MFSRHREGDRLSIGLLRGVLAGFAIASMFGMPGQSIAIVMTFWSFAFWLWLERTPTSEAATQSEWPTKAVIAALLLIAVHAGMTTVEHAQEMHEIGKIAAGMRTLQQFLAAEVRMGGAAMIGHAGEQHPP